MAYAAKILADSMSPTGFRLTTFQITFPRFVLAEFNTHRVFSRCSASSRAIPVEKRIEAIKNDPFVPEAFAENKRGMQAGEVMDVDAQGQARNMWLAAAKDAVDQAGRLAELGVHKQWANRLLEPFTWHTVIVTATEWANYWALRVSEHAQPEIRIVSEMMLSLYNDRSYRTLRSVTQGQWHLPLVGEEYGDNPALVEADPALYGAVSCARCARVSYLTHEGIRDLQADMNLYERLVSMGHMSPLEHVARPMTAVERGMGEWCGNFRGWVQHRKELPGEGVFRGGTS